MTNCTFYPERCKAKHQYEIEKNKFIKTRINDAIKERSLIDQTYMNRIKSKRVEKYLSTK